MKRTLTPTQKKILYYTNLFKKIKIQYSIKSLTTWRDVLTAIGHREGEIEVVFEKEQLDNNITFPEIKLLESRYIYEAQNNFDEETSNNIRPDARLPYEFEGVIYGIEGSETRLEERVDKIILFSSSSENKEEIPLLTSPKQKAKLMKFQNDNAWKLIKKSYYEKKRAVLVRGGVGVGKTFVLGAYLRYILDKNIIEEYRCCSPWPIVWITRATIVEQTERHLGDGFGIDLYSECNVINIEQLRAKFGEYLLDEETIVRGGEEHIVWKWREKMLPLVVVIDECQMAKNEMSTQSKIICALAEVTKPIFIICTSATPFTRVLEAKYLCINTHMPLN